MSYLALLEFCGHKPLLLTKSMSREDDNLQVSNNVHYIWSYNKQDPPYFEMKFTQYIVNKSIKLRKVHEGPLVKLYHASDIIHLWLSIIYGGIYIDENILVLKSFDHLRELANGVIVAKLWSSFLRL